MPFQGATASVKKVFRRTPEAVYRTPRQHLSFAQSDIMTADDKEQMMRAWREISEPQSIKQRKYDMRMRRHRLFLRGELVDPRRLCVDPITAESRSGSPAPRMENTSAAIDRHMREEEINVPPPQYERGKDEV